MAFRKSKSKPYRVTKWLLPLLIIIVIVGLIFFRHKSVDIDLTSNVPTESPYPTGSQPEYYDFFKYKLTSKPNLSHTVNWTTYKNPEFGLEFKYPSTWRVSHDSYVFPQRELITVIGDGGYSGDAYFSVANPTLSSKSVNAWYFDSYKLVTPAPEPLETETINSMEFKKKFTAGAVCQTYYYLHKNGYIFEFALSTYCDKKSKEMSDQTLVNIINTLKFSN